jgi:multidrug transporter EmrE-like cation transporter
LAGLFFLLSLINTGFTVSVFIWIGLVTISSVIYGVILLKEPINMPVWVGFGLIVTGVLLVQLNSSEA